MTHSYERVSREFLQGIPTSTSDEAVGDLTALLERVVAEERDACAGIAEETMRLYGSHAAEQVMIKIRARGEDGP